MLEVRDLTIRYGGVLAVDGISLEVRTGEIVALVGANGAGKSSIMAGIAGLLRPAAGSILLEGHEIAGLPSHRVMSRGLALCPEGRMILGGLTVRENLELAAPGRREFGDLYELFPILHEQANSAKTLWILLPNLILDALTIRVFTRFDVPLKDPVRTGRRTDRRRRPNRSDNPRKRPKPR